MYKYHPETLELINTELALDWASTTDIAPPQLTNCFFVNGAWEVRPDYVEPDLTYAQKRQAAHLPIQDQLDMQYHDAINGTTLWLDYVTAIKTSIPKESV